AGFIASTLTYTRALSPSVTRRIRTSGVLPIDCRIVSCMMSSVVTEQWVSRAYCRPERATRARLVCQSVLRADRGTRGSWHTGRLQAGGQSARSIRGALLFHGGFHSAAQIG